MDMLHGIIIGLLPQASDLVSTAATAIGLLFALVAGALFWTFTPR